MANSSDIRSKVFYFRLMVYVACLRVVLKFSMYNP
jgi:hypothetical protein